MYKYLLISIKFKQVAAHALIVHVINLYLVSMIVFIPPDMGALDTWSSACIECPHVRWYNCFVLQSRPTAPPHWHHQPSAGLIKIWSLGYWVQAHVKRQMSGMVSGLYSSSKYGGAISNMRLYYIQCTHCIRMCVCLLCFVYTSSSPCKRMKLISKPVCGNQWSLGPKGGCSVAMLLTKIHWKSFRHWWARVSTRWWWSLIGRLRWYWSTCRLFTITGRVCETKCCESLFCIKELAGESQFLVVIFDYTKVAPAVYLEC